MRIAAVILGLALIAPARAASLDDTVRRAVATYPSIPESAAGRRATEAELDGARAAWGPRVEVEGFVGPHAVDRPASLSKDVNREWRMARQVGVTARQTIFDGWTRENEIYKQGMRTNSAAFRVLERAGQVAIDAVEAHIDVVRHSRVLAMADENIAAHQRILADIQARFSGGGAGAGEMEQARERLAAAHAIRSEILRSVGAAQAKYKRMTGSAPKALAGPRAPKLLPKSKQTALSIAHASHPSLIAAGFDIKSVDAEVEQSKARSLPTVGVEGRASVGQDLGGVGNWNNEAQARLSLSWTLYDGGVIDSRKRQSIERRTEQELRRDRMLREIDETVEVAWSDISATSQRLEALRRQIMASERVVQVYRDEFLGGRRTLIDVLDAQNSLFNTRVATAGAEAINVFTRYKLIAATGRILNEFGVTAPKDAAPLPTGAIGDIRRLGIQLEPIR
jgi:adhesin transport system outer membrane protein